MPSNPLASSCDYGLWSWRWLVGEQNAIQLWVQWNAVVEQLVGNSGLAMTDRVKCGYCNYSTPPEAASKGYLGAGRNLKRHLELYHPDKWTKFEQSPSSQPLVSWQNILLPPVWLISRVYCQKVTSGYYLIVPIFLWYEQAEKNVVPTKHRQSHFFAVDQWHGQLVMPRD